MVRTAGVLRSGTKWTAFVETTDPAPTNVIEVDPTHLELFPEALQPIVDDTGMKYLDAAKKQVLLPLAKR